MRAFRPFVGDFHTTSTQTVEQRTRNARQRLMSAIARVVADFEPLECRRMMSATVTGSVTLDESNGLQNSGVAVTGEDNNDSDVALSTMQTQAATFYNRLFGSATAGL